METEEIKNKLEALKAQAYGGGFIKITAEEVTYRELVADWLMPLIGTKSLQKENFVRVNPENEVEDCS